ncbi:MAG TPA: DUF1326 domain-containing protein [Chthoniobacterales bacterium]|nr:DUF1326 domain-containing protein [Chthoniobacterales bacterium]
MKRISITIAVAVAVIQTVARAAEEPAWALEGRSISADSCGVDCPCNLGGPPQNGECRFIQIRQVDKGRYGDVKLDGVKFGMAGQFTREVTGGPTKFSFVAFYIDSGATAEQKEALRKLFSGPSFAGLGQPAELKEAAIKFENLDAFGQVGKTASGTMGEIAKVEDTPIGGGTHQDDPMVIVNQASPGFEWTALGKTSNSFYKSAGKDFKFDGTSGESVKFSMKGGGEK